MIMVNNENSLRFQRDPVLVPTWIIPGTCESPFVGSVVPRIRLQFQRKHIGIVLKLEADS